MKKREPDLSIVLIGRTRDTVHKLKHKKFRLNTRKLFFFFFNHGVVVAKQCDRLPREVMEAPSVDVLKNLLDTFPNNLL